MTIEKLVMYLGGLLVACFLAVLTTSQMAMQRLKVNGPIYQDIERSKDLVADILPPPKYIIEPYLEATLALNDPASVEAHAKRLEGLRKEYDIRQNYWLQQQLGADLKRGLTDSSHAPAMQFWSTLDKTFLPALRQGDMEAAKAAYADLTRAYGEHRKQIDEVVGLAGAHIAQTETGAQSDVNSTMVAVWSGAVGLLALLVGTVWWLLNKVMAPLKQLTGSMVSMAKGELAAEVPYQSRQDEIGDMAHALAVYRHVVSGKKAEPEKKAAERVAAPKIASDLDDRALRELEEMESRIKQSAAVKPEDTAAAPRQRDVQAAASAQSPSPASRKKK